MLMRCVSSRLLRAQLRTDRWALLATWLTVGPPARHALTLLLANHSPKRQSQPPPAQSPPRLQFCFRLCFSKLLPGPLLAGALQTADTGPGRTGAAGGGAGKSYPAHLLTCFHHHVTVGWLSHRDGDRVGRVVLLRSIAALIFQISSISLYRFGPGRGWHVEFG